MPTSSSTPWTSSAPPEPGPEDHVRGDGRLVIEYADLECPYCAKAHALLAGLPVRRVFRHFPVVSKHPRARVLAAAAEAAGLQGRFWEMHDLIYENQKEWSDSMEPRVQFDSYATRLGLDVQKFKADMERQDLADRIKADMMRGNSLGVKGTPAVYLNGRELVPGRLVTEEDLRREIEAALGQAGK